MQKITPMLWFDGNVEEAVNLYTSIFKDSKIGKIARYDETAAKATGFKVGSVMTASFTLFGQEFVALNGGPHFKFNEAVSFVVNCETQEEVDYYWNSLTKDGGQESQCGWLKDKFGLSWQITPTILIRLINDPDKQKAQKAFMAMLQMKKIDIATLEKAVNS